MFVKIITMEKTRELNITLENQIPKPLNIQFDGSKVGFGFQYVEYTLVMDERLFCDIISIELIDNKNNEYNIIITGRDVEYIDTSEEMHDLFNSIEGHKVWTRTKYDYTSILTDKKKYTTNRKTFSY